jgi:hypothetical protein
METVLLSVRSSILSGFRTLPLILISFIGFLAVGIGNMGLFMLFIGHILIIPLLYISNWIFISLPAPIHSRVGMLVPTATSTELYDPGYPSFWMGHICFFFGYLLMNAGILYGNQKGDTKIDKQFVNKRKSKARSILIFGCIILGILIGLRMATGAEKTGGIIVALVVAGGLGIGWHALVSACGVGMADVFGISSQMGPSINPMPTTCVYSPKP